MFFNQNYKSLFDLSFILLVSFFLFKGIPVVPFHGDESTIIYLSKDFDKLFKGELSEIVFNAENNNQFIWLTTGSIIPLTIYCNWKLAGYDVSEINNNWDWESKNINSSLNARSTWEANLKNGNVPKDKLLIISRYSSSLYTLISFILIYYIVYFISQSRIAAFISSFAFITNPVVLLHGNRAMQEGIVLFCTSLLFFVTFKIIKEFRSDDHSFRRHIYNFCLLGFICGFSIAGKHNLIVNCSVSYLILICYFLVKNKSSIIRLRYFFILFISLNIMILTFFIFNPFWWTTVRLISLVLMVLLLILIIYQLFKDPQFKLSKIIPPSILLALVFLIVVIVPFFVLLFTRVKLISQQEINVSPLITFCDKVEWFWKEMKFMVYDNYYELDYWSGFSIINRQIELFKNSYFAIWLDCSIYSFILFTLLVIGILLLGYKCFLNKDIISIFCLSFFIIPAAIILATNILPWQRYYLVFYPQAFIIIGFSIGVLISFTKNIIKCR